MAIIVIDIGGTGARCAAAAMYALTSGLAESSRFSAVFGSKIRFLHIDKDANNGTGKNSESAILNYRSMYEKSEGLRGKFPAPYQIEWDFWNINDLSSGEENSSLEKTFASEKDLLDLLFAEEDQTRELDCGFEQRPALGAVYFERICDGLEEIIRQYVENDTDATAVFIFASAFGGCGASMFTHVGKLVRNKLNRDDVFVGGAFMEPYFMIPPLTKSFEEKKAAGDFRLRTDDLIPATQKALAYYATIPNLYATESNFDNSGEDHFIFDALYPLGLYPLCNNIKKSGDLDEGDFVKGQDAQRSLYSLADMLAALALCDFLSRAAKGQAAIKPTKNTHNLMNTKLKHLAKNPSTYEITPFAWDNLPNSAEVKERLIAMAKFAIYTTSYLCPEYFEAVVDEDNSGIRKSELGRQIKRLHKSVDDQETIKAVFTQAKQFLDFIRDVAATNAGNGKSRLTELFDVDGLDHLLKTLGEDIRTAAGSQQALRDYSTERFDMSHGGLVFGTDKRTPISDERLAYNPERIRTVYTALKQKPGNAAEFFSGVYDACLALTKEVA